MNKLTKSKYNLPVNIKELNEFILIESGRLKAVRAKIKVINDLGLSKEVREQAMSEAQDTADKLLDAEVRMGEILKGIEKKYTISSIEGTNRPQREQTLPDGITKKQSHFYQTLASNQEVVEQVKAEARENEDLPTRTEVIRKVNEIKNQKRNDDLRNNNIPQVKGKYDVIIIDPPWQMEKIDRDVTPQQTGFDYPTMTTDEIKALTLPAKTDCHVFMWTTQKYLPLSFEIFNHWGVNYILTMVWHKNGGFQPFNLPQYNCEFILYGRIGSPHFIDLKNFNTCFNADRKGHSVKPDEFYDLVRRVTGGKRIDMFNRRDIEGFDKWGNECQ